MKHRLHRLPRHRRKEHKTNYKKRLKLLQSGKPRLVVRITNTKVIAQLVKYKPEGDEVVVSAYSTELSDHGWKGSFSNTPAAYLTGMLIAKKAADAGVKEAVLDIGLRPPVKGSKMFAVAKGANESGLDVPVDDEIVPGEDRLKGEHIEKDLSKQFEKVVSSIGEA